MSTRDWKIGEVVYLKSGSPAMTVTGTDSHGATKVQWYDPQAVEVERSMYPTVVFPKDCLTEAEVPVRMPASDLGAFRVPQLLAEPIRVVAPQSSTEDLRQSVLSTLRDLLAEPEKPRSLIDRLLACPMQTWPSESIRSLRDRLQQVQFVEPQPAQPNEKIVEATTRATEQQRTEQATAQPTAVRTEPARSESRRKG